MASYLGVDPGTWESAYVGYDVDTNEVLEHGFVSNDELLLKFRTMDFEWEYDKVCIEMIASYGMPVGKTTFDTVLMIGRIVEILDRMPGVNWRLVFRKKILTWFCQGNSAGDTALGSALRDRFPATGGGSKPSVGIKSKPGPLYGISKHKWAALGVVVYGAESEGTWNKIPDTTIG